MSIESSRFVCSEDWGGEVEVVSRDYGFVVYPSGYEGARLPKRGEDKRCEASIERVVGILNCFEWVDEVAESQFMTEDDVRGIDLIVYSAQMGRLGVNEFFVQVKSSREGARNFRKNGKKKKTNLDIVVLNGQDEAGKVADDLREQLWVMVGGRCDIDYEDFLAVFSGGI